MRRRRIVYGLLVLIFVVLIISMIDVSLRFGIDLRDYIKFNNDLTSEEEALIREKPILIGVYDDPPLSFTNEFNNYNSGIMVDYLSQLAIETRSNISIKVRDSESIIEALHTKEIDLIVLEKTVENLKNADLTQPICVVKTRILVANNSGINNLNDLNGKKLVALSSDNINEKIDKFFEGNIKVDIVEVENMYQCFALIRNQEVSGYVGDDMEVAHFLNVTNKSTNFKFLDSVLFEKEISLAVEKGNTRLLNILNKGILELKKKNLIAQTQYKWLGDFDTSSIDLRSVQTAYNVSLIIIAIVGVFSSWNYVITKRVNTKTRELLESKEELRLIIDKMQSGIIVVESGSLIVECNDALLRLTGMTREYLIGRKYDTIETLKIFTDNENMNKVLNIGNDYYYITSQKVANNKSMIVIEDYTEKYLTEKRARHESKMIAVGQLSAGLAHEIRNPLGLIKSYSYIVERHKINEICDHAMLIINESVDRINKLIENLLRFSRLSNDETKPVNIGKLIDSIVEMEKSFIDQENINIVNIFKSQYSEVVVINEGVIRMVIQNLIRNSIDSFSGIDREEKTIILSSIVGIDKLNLKISDNGSGIDKGKIDSIFDPFYTTKENGTGLGLYIVSTEIANNNGTISVESEIDKGTAFEIVLPITR